MKRGKLRVNKDHKIDQWVIQGKKPNGAWVNASDGEKNLLFDIKYDACAYLQSIVEWHKDEIPTRSINRKIDKAMKIKKEDRKKKNKQRKKANRRHR